MINGNSVVAIIPARGGSKGIKDKNIIDLCGKPLLAYSIEAALNCKYIDDVVVSTDSEKIADVARQYGASVPFIRPASLAGDESKTIDVIIHVIEELKKTGINYDTMVLIQATSPLRDCNDIEGALEKYIRNDKKSLVAVSKVSDSPILIRRLIDENHMENLLSCDSTVRRQDMPQYYRVNGSIYINSVNELSQNTSFNDNVVPYIIDETHAVDIDELKDVEIAKYYLKKK